MAATCNLALGFFIFLLLHLLLSRDSHSSNDQERASGATSSGFSLIPVAFLRHRFRSGPRRLVKISRRIQRVQLAWSKHGYTCFSPPDFEPIIDITMDMDVSINPGPWKNEILSTGKPSYELSATPPSCQITASRLNYSRDSLFRLSYYPKSVIETHIFEDLKRSGLFTYRGKRGGGRKTRRHAKSCFIVSSSNKTGMTLMITLTSIPR